MFLKVSSRTILNSEIEFWSILLEEMMGCLIIGNGMNSDDKYLGNTSSEQSKSLLSLNTENHFDREMNIWGMFHSDSCK